MSTLNSEQTAPQATSKLGGWYALFALVLLGVVLYFVLGTSTPILFDVLPAGAAA